MFEKNMRIAYLLDFYGDLLDEHTASVMRAYYNDDLSLSEVAGDVGISRQGIRHIIKKGEEMLEFYDSRLGLAERFAELERASLLISEVADSLESSTEQLANARKLREVVATITKGN